MKIGYKVFGQNTLNYGLSLCLCKNKIQAESVTEKTAKMYDVIVFSIFWWQHVIDFVQFCDAAKIGKNVSEKPYIIVGGFNTFNPVLFKKHAHCVVVGDGEDVISKAIARESHPSFYTGAETEVIYNQCDIAKNQFIYSNETKISRIEIARGCPHHCSFCQLSALKKYREMEFPAIKECLAKTGKCVALFAPNKTSHSQFEQIKELVKQEHKLDVVPDVRFNDVEKFYTGGMYQIGVEGISERLRFMVRKKMTDERYREIITFLINKGLRDGGRPALTVGYILDLPTETEDDWKQFADFLDNLQNIKGIQYFNMFFVFNMFMPCPFTPLENETINYQRLYQPKIKAVLHKDRKFKVAVHGRLFSNYSRILSMICTRGGENTPDILTDIFSDESIKNLPDSSKILPLKHILRKYGGIEQFVGVPTVAPWRMVQVSHKTVLNPSGSEILPSKV